MGREKEGGKKRTKIKEIGGEKYGEKKGTTGTLGQINRDQGDIFHTPAGTGVLYDPRPRPQTGTNSCKQQGKQKQRK